MTKQIHEYTHNYPSDLTDDQWALLEPLLGLDPLEPARTHPMRNVLDGIFYFTRSGCARRSIPGDLPPWNESSITSTSGARMVRGNGYIPPSGRLATRR